MTTNYMKNSWIRFLAATAMLLTACGCGAAGGATGDDLLGAFARAQAGEPLRVVAIGGSITQVGAGWVGPWLRETFPRSRISVHNAGMSGTGSQLAIFRLERDVIAHQPDLVMFEFAVNDGNGGAHTVWSVESVIRRLKNLEKPPAIVMIEAAQRGREFIPPQRKVAEHYGLLTVDMQAAMQKHLAAKDLAWEDLLPDGGHPNSAGHNFYRETVAAALRPFAERAGRAAPSAPQPLPAVLSDKPLILDGRLEPVPAAGAWRREASVPGWWDRFFRGVTVGRTEGEVLTIPFRGTTVGLFYTLDARNGIFQASVDGAAPVQVDTGYRSGYAHTILGEGLAPGEHLLHIVIPRDGGARDNGVALGYVLVGGEKNASAERAPQSACTPETLSQARLDATTAQKLVREAQALRGGVSAGKWAWIGPFGDISAALSPGADMPPPDLQRIFWPERDMGTMPNRTPPDTARDTPTAWTRGQGKDAKLDFAKLTGCRDRGVAYAWTVVDAARAQTVPCRLKLDYFGRIWLNGKLIHSVAAGHGHVTEGIWFDLPLAAGRNHLVIKTHAGSAGFSLALATVPSAGQPLVFVNPLDPPAKAHGLTLRNTFTKCLTAKKLTIVIIGNSVSNGQRFESGYSAHVHDWFAKTFPEATIDVKRGIISSIGSEVQLFRMDDKLFAHEPDLVVAEFGAANTAADSGWGEPGKITRQSLEGYARHLRRRRPEADFLLNHSIHQSGMEAYRRGGVPVSVAFHRQVAAHYGCALAEPGTEIARRVIAGEPWSAFMGDPIHPNAGGYAVHGEVIRAELDRQYKLYRELADKDRTVRAHPLPEPVLPDAWEVPRLVSASAAAKLTGFTEAASGRVRYIEAAATGAAGRFAPDTGRIVGIWRHCGTRGALLDEGPMARLEVRLDGVGKWTPLPLQKEPVVVDDNDRNNVQRRQFFGAYGLPLYARSLEFRVAAPTEGAGQAPVRIIGFFVVENINNRETNK